MYKSIFKRCARNLASFLNVMFESKVMVLSACSTVYSIICAFSAAILRELPCDWKRSTNLISLSSVPIRFRSITWYPSRPVSLTLRMGGLSVSHKCALCFVFSIFREGEYNARYGNPHDGNTDEEQYEQRPAYIRIEGDSLCDDGITQHRDE